VACISPNQSCRVCEAAALTQSLPTHGLVGGESLHLKTRPCLDKNDGQRSASRSKVCHSGGAQRPFGLAVRGRREIELHRSQTAMPLRPIFGVSTNGLLAPSTRNCASFVSDALLRAETARSCYWPWAFEVGGHQRRYQNCNRSLIKADALAGVGQRVSGGSDLANGVSPAESMLASTTIVRMGHVSDRTSRDRRKVPPRADICALESVRPGRSRHRVRSHNG
jgi:hypothetical protein